MIQVSHLTKYYGDFLAVNDLSFEIKDNGVYGFLGPNGAGKSTTMNIMTGCLSPTDGIVKIGDFDILEEPRQAKQLIGYLPEQPPLYLNETPQEYLTFVGEAKGLRGSKLKEDIDKAIESVGLEQMRNRLIGTLSKGYRQRVGIAQALLGDPRVIILDEPTVGLDPIQIIEIRDFIKELGKAHTVILSSHILSEVQAVCEQVLIISKGRLVAFDTPENLEKLLLAANGITFQVEASKSEAEEILSQIEGLSGWDIAQEADVCRILANLTEGQDAKAICGKITMTFASHGFPVFEMRTKKANLEDVFLELTEAGIAEETFEEPDMITISDLPDAAEASDSEDDDADAEDIPKVLDTSEMEDASEIPEVADILHPAEAENENEEEES